MGGASSFGVPTDEDTPRLARLGAWIKSRPATWRAQLLATLRDPERSWVALTWLAAIALVTGCFIHVLGPMLEDWSTFGFHDWGTHSAYRYITVISVGEYGEPPWWHPWFCGGFPAMGNHGGAPNFISPWLPIYLTFDIQHAVRLEVIGGALFGSIGAWLFAGRFTKSVALRTLVVVLFMLNNRWSMQAAVGHTWHLEYCWLPWVLYFFDRSLDPGKLFNAVIAGMFIAMMAYHGAIYPAPHAALICGFYAVIMAIMTRRWQPIYAITLVGVVAFCLASIKLFMLADALSQAPRTIDSTEAIDLGKLATMMTHHGQDYGSFPTPVPAYNWHEWGLYIGVPGLLIVIVSALYTRGTRAQALRLVALLFLLLGLGAIHEFAPWPLLHKLPFFKAMHVPSRFHYPMLLLVGVVFVALVARFYDLRLRRRPWLDLLVLIPIAAMAIDMSIVSRRPMERAWYMIPRDATPSPTFEHTNRGKGVRYERPDWAAPILLAMKANRGIMECYGVPPSIAKGAISSESPDYQGMAYLPEGRGTAEIIDWSPNRATVKVSGAEPGDLVVYNMNWDPSWRADGAYAENYENAVAAFLPEGADTIEFEYSPRTLKYSLPLSLFTLAAIIGFPIWRRRRRARLEAKPEET